MEIAYQRNLKNSYMIIRGDAPSSEYDRKMLERRKCSSFLPAEVLDQDGEVQYWYDVSGKQSLDVYLSAHFLGEDFFEKFLSALGQTGEWIENYLLEERHLVLRTETIFLDADTLNCSFCYCPICEEELTGQFQKLMEQLLKSVDHRKERAVCLAYRLYDISRKEGYQFGDLKRALCEVGEMRESEARVEEPLGREYKKAAVRDSVSDNKKVAVRESISGGEAGEAAGRNEQGADTGMYRHPAGKRWSGRRHITAIAEQIQTLRQKWGNRSDNFPVLGIRGELFKSLSRGKPRSRETEPFCFEPEEEEPAERHPTVLLSTKKEEAYRGILLYEGSGKQENLSITELPFLIGSDAASVQGVIESETVSRIHARITREGGIYFLEDLNSTNGTFVDHEILNYKVKVGLQANSRIRFADENYRFL